MVDRLYTVRELTAVFFSQWEDESEVDKYENRMFTDFIEALEDPNRCQCIGENGRLMNNCDECPR